MKECYKKLFLVFLIVLFIYPAMLFSQWTFKHIGIFFISLEELTKDYQHIFQALTSLGIFGILFSWWRWRNEERENIERNLSSISVSVDLNAVASIKNTSSINGSKLYIEVYKPWNFEKFNKNSDNKEFNKYVAVDKEDYFKIKKDLSRFNLINWNYSDPVIATLSIGEIVQFHLKDVQNNDYVHFAPIMIKIKMDSNKLSKKYRTVKKYMLFRFAPENLRSEDEFSPIDEFIREQLHPYHNWTLIYSEIKDET